MANNNTSRRDLCSDNESNVSTFKYFSHNTMSNVTMGPRPLGPKEIDGLLVSPGKAFSLLTDYLITGYPLRSELGQEK